MRIVEIVLQGVRGSPDTRRLPLAPGLNVWVPQDEPVPLGPLLAWALHGVPPETPLAAPGASAPRVGLALLDGEGRAHRLLRDLSTGAVRLSQRGEDGFTPLASRPGEVAAYLKARLAVPDAAALEALWVVGPPVGAAAETTTDLLSGPVGGGLPPRQGGAPAARDRGEAGIHGQGMLAAMEARRPGAAAQSPAARRPSALPPTAAAGALAGPAASDADLAGLDREALEARRAELISRKAAAEAAEALQFEADGLHRRLAELDGEVERRARLEADAAAAEARLAEARARVDLPGDLPALLTARGDAEARRDKVLTRLLAQREALEARAGHPPEPLWRDGWVLGGVGAAAAVLLLAVAVPGLRVLAASVPLVLGAALAGVWRWTLGGEAHARDARLAAALDQRAEEATRIFEEASAPVHALLEAGGFEGAEALLAHTRTLARLEAEAAARRERAGQGSGEHPGDPAAERAEVSERIEALEQRLQGLSGEAQSALEVDRALSAVDAALQRIRAGGPPAAPAPFGGAPGLQAPAPEGVRPGPLDPLEEEVAALVAVTGRPPADVRARLGDRLPVWLAPLSGEQVSVLVTDAGVEAARAGGPHVPLAEAEPQDRAIVRLALRLAAAEAALASGPGTLVVDRAFDDLPPDRRPVVARMLAHLGRRGVVLHQTRHAGAGRPPQRGSVRP